MNFERFSILRKNVGILCTLRNFAECCVCGINSTFSCLPRLIAREIGGARTAKFAKSLKGHNFNQRKLCDGNS